MGNCSLSWAESHRNQIGAMLLAIGTVVRLVSTMLIRTLGGAGAMFAYLFYHATPETTVHQLAQFGHQDGFWVFALMIAAAYSLVLFAAVGPSQRVIRAARHSAGGACTAATAKP